jgi:hypothetical protein
MGPCAIQKTLRGYRLPTKIALADLPYEYGASIAAFYLIIEFAKWGLQVAGDDLPKFCLVLFLLLLWIIPLFYVEPRVKKIKRRSKHAKKRRQETTGVLSVEAA